MGQTFGVKYEKSPSFKFSLSAIPIFLIIFATLLATDILRLAQVALLQKRLST